MHAHFFIIIDEQNILDLPWDYYLEDLCSSLDKFEAFKLKNVQLLFSNRVPIYFLSNIIIRNCQSSIKAIFIVLNDLPMLNQNIHLLLTTQPMTGRQLYTVYFVLCMYCLLFTLYCVLGTVYCILCIVYFVLCTVFYVLYTVYCLLCTI